MPWSRWPATASDRPRAAADARSGRDRRDDWHDPAVDRAETQTIAEVGTSEAPSKTLTRSDLRRWAEIAVSVVLVGVSSWYLFHAIQAFTSLSLWTDELYSVLDYSRRGPIHTLTSYDAANNHVFFNLLNSLTPGAGSVDPGRARFWSFVSAIALPVIGGAELARRRWYLAGALFFAVFASSPEWLDLALQARGYGLLALCALVASIGTWRYFEEPRRRWLAVVGVASLIGCWTLPSFAIFVVPLWVMVILLRRRRAVVVAAAVAGLATGIAYLGVIGQVLDQYNSYADQFGVQFRGADVFRSVHTYLLGDRYVWRSTVVWVLGALGAGLVLVGWPPIVARSLSVTARVLVATCAIFFIVCVIIQTSPPRTTAFVSVVLGLVVAASVGSLAAQHTNRGVYLAATTLLFAWAALGGYNVIRQPGPDTWVPMENWKGAAQYIEATFPTGTIIFVAPRQPPRFLQEYIDDAFPVVGQFDEEAFTEGRLIVLEFGASARDKVFEPDQVTGSPVAEIDLPQSRGRTLPTANGVTPAHAMRLLFAPFPGGRPNEVHVDDRAALQLYDGDGSSTAASPPSGPGNYSVTISAPSSSPTRSVAIAIASGKVPRLLRVTAIGPEGSQVVDPTAVTRSAGRHHDRARRPNHRPGPRRLGSQQRFRAERDLVLSAHAGLRVSRRLR